MARAALEVAFTVPGVYIAENGSLVPPRPPRVQIECNNTFYSPDPEVTLPLHVCGLYNLEMKLYSGTLWLKMTRGEPGQLGRETYMPVAGVCGLDPFVAPRGRSSATTWLLPAGISASRRVVVTLTPAAITREQGYGYKEAYAQAHRGVSAIERQLCSGVVSQVTAYQIQCGQTTFTFRVVAHRERLHANPFDDFTLGLNE